VTRLTVKALGDWRTERMAKNGGRCGICQLPVRRPAADHDHATGQLRDTVCSGCNATLGKIENSYRRYGVQNLAAFLMGAGPYLQKHATPQHGLLYPTHRTPDEKRVTRNAKARKTRAAAKESL